MLLVLIKHAALKLRQAWTLCRQGQDAPPPRVIVFASNEQAAAAAADPLRTALWGQHTLSVLLPHGEEPIKVSMETSNDRAETAAMPADGFVGLCLMHKRGAPQQSTLGSSCLSRTAEGPNASK